MAESGDLSEPILRECTYCDFEVVEEVRDADGKLICKKCQCRNCGKIDYQI